VPLMVFSPKFRAHTWLFMNFQTWSKTRTKQFRTAVCEPSYTKIEKWLIFVRNQWKYDKHKEGLFFPTLIQARREFVAMNRAWDICSLVFKSS
jgi:hypothetical protein